MFLHRCTDETELQAWPRGWLRTWDQRWKGTRMFRRKSMASGAMILLVALSFLLLSPVALAQTYRFNLSDNQVHLYINGDGTVRIVYDMTFANDPTADPIDAIDVGLPNDTYDLSNIRASINGVPLTDISHSPASSSPPLSSIASSCTAPPVWRSISTYLPG
jgi:hypothetical protein